MSELLQADLDAIRGLAGKQRGSASDVRGLDFSQVFAGVTGGLAGSDVAAQCAAAGGKIADALAQVANRVDALAEANRRAADTIGLADETYASSIRATLNLEP